jgi:hypothetical protein
MKAKDAVKRIREITELLYDGYGEDIHPAEQINMIRVVLEKHKESRRCKE